MNNQIEKQFKEFLITNRTKMLKREYQIFLRSKVNMLKINETDEINFNLHFKIRNKLKEKYSDFQYVNTFLYELQDKLSILERFNLTLKIIKNDIISIKRTIDSLVEQKENDKRMDFFRPNPISVQFYSVNKAVGIMNSVEADMEISDKNFIEYLKTKLLYLELKKEIKEELNKVQNNKIIKKEKI